MCFEQAISDKIGFRFKLYTVPDNLYGVEDPETGEWNGIVRQLMDRRADMAVASMTINYARETVIDFTKPFMNLGISILFKVRHVILWPHSLAESEIFLELFMI